MKLHTALVQGSDRMQRMTDTFPCVLSRICTPLQWCWSLLECWLQAGAMRFMRNAKFMRVVASYLV